MQRYVLKYKNILVLHLNVVIFIRETVVINRMTTSFLRGT
jgi:hypothetical protein